ncbi:MAG: biotin--[acetyl-CoA-carboxylase] ligase [Promethearchaeota archaeon]|jgi:BirA family biotin operon repressor/biotin-[acetyl-CoA-carboxylase] ligase
MFSKIKIVYIHSTSSTQDSILDYLKNDYYSSLLLVAKTQTGGRGRNEDDWYSPEGGFWATLGISSTLSLNTAQWALFHYFTASLLTRIIKEEYNIQVQIKWPNDILYDTKKLAGILIDYVTGSQKNYILIGMGVNLNNSSVDAPESLKSIVISIKDIINKSVSLEEFSSKICTYALQYFLPITESNIDKIQSLIREYNQNLRIYGKKVILDDSKTYICKGINIEGLMGFSRENFNLKLTIDELSRVQKIKF